MTARRGAGAFDRDVALRVGRPLDEAKLHSSPLRSRLGGKLDPRNARDRWPRANQLKPALAGRYPTGLRGKTCGCHRSARTRDRKVSS